MTSPDLSSRIEAAARAICRQREVQPDMLAYDDHVAVLKNGVHQRCWQMVAAELEEGTRLVLPELFTDPPSAWLAPWEATHEMTHAHGDPYEQTTLDSRECERVWDAMRDAHLNPNPEESQE